MMIRILLKSILLAMSLFFLMTLSANAESLNALFHNDNDPVAGNPNGKVTIVEFFDYQCSHCVNMAPIMDAIIKANPNVRVVFKEFPIRGQMSELAARAALAANKQNKYYPLHHALLTTNLSLTQNTIMDLAKGVGLDTNQLKKDMQSSNINKQLNANLNLARELNVSGTPAFYIGKTDAKNNSEVNFVLGEMSQSELQDAINKSRS